MSSGGVERLRTALPARFGECRARHRSLPRDATGGETVAVEFVVDDARATLVLSVAEAIITDTEMAARAAAVGVEERLYGVLTSETITVRRIQRWDDPGQDRVIRTAALDRLERVLALVAQCVRSAASALYERLDALRRAVEPLARARLDRRLEDDSFSARLRDSLRAAGPAADDATLGDDERAALAAQSSCLFVDALVAARVSEPAVFDGLAADPGPAAWSALLDELREGLDDPLFDPAETPIADLVLHPPPGVEGFDATADAVGEVRRALDRTWLSFEGSTLARLFEQFVPVDRRWRWGQVYTPTAVARLLADWAVGDDQERGRERGGVSGDGDAGGGGDSRPDQGARGAVLDPACGTGRLLRAAVESRADRGQPPPMVYGRDVFALPVELTARSLPDDVTAHVATGDFFTCVPATADGGDEGEDEGRVEPPTGSGGGDRLPLVDAVLVNPPYTRHEALDDDYVSFVRRAVVDGSSVDRRAGLAPYFLRHAASFLREGGRMAVVVGSSWLDADYGASLQSFLLETFRIRAVVGAPRHHLVDTADVNAVLLLLERASDAESRDDGVVSFLRLRADPTDLAADDDLFASLLEGTDAVAESDRHGVGRGEHGTPDVDVVRRRQATLGSVRANGSRRTGGKWGRYVRAPPAYWEVFERCGDRFVDLEALATADWARLSYGTRSGAPDFFYLPNAHHDVAVAGRELRVVPTDETGVDEPCRLPRRNWMHRATDAERATADADGWVPNFLLKRTTGIERLGFDVGDLELGRELRYVVRFPESRSALDPAARAYVEWGEHHDVTACPHCRRAKPFPAYCPGERWYDITGRLTRGTILPNKDVHATHAYWTPSTPLWVHQSLYGIDAVDPPLLAGLLNSTLGLLFVEVAGRVNLGEGALDLMTGDHRSVHVPDPRTVDSRTRDCLVERFEAVASRSLGTVFEECGARRRAAVSLERVAPDRRALDEVVMGDLLGLPPAVQEGVYRGLVGLVDDRLTKAARGR